MTDVVDQFLNNTITHLEYFMVGIDNLLVPFDQIQSLTFNRVPLLENVDKNGWEISILQFRCGNLDIKLPSNVVLELNSKIMSF